MLEFHAGCWGWARLPWTGEGGDGQESKEDGFQEAGSIGLGEIKDIGLSGFLQLGGGGRGCLVRFQDSKV